jgi:murein DD-endopeptidase MepM/ murein hydrolase activator NlpD
MVFSTPTSSVQPETVTQDASLSPPVEILMEDSDAEEPGVQPVEQWPCSPLSDHDLDSLHEIVSANYQPPISVQEERHHGVDFSYYRQGERASIQGEEVRAVYSGFVAASVNDRFPYGNMIILETPLDWLRDYPVESLGENPSGSLYHLYAHLEAPSKLQSGARVDRCQVLGAVGKSGNAGVPHLHLEMRTGPPGARFESMAYYSTAASQPERLSYERWRTGGEFIHFDPMSLLLP